MRPISFIEPASLRDVISELSDEGEAACLIAGGSDLLGELKEGVAEYRRLVSLGGLDELRVVERGPEGLRLGALTTLSRLELGPELSAPYGILAEAARSIATPEIRNQGTLGGNLCQRPRCLHYRHPLVSCLKKGGDGCPAVDTPYQAYLSVMGGAGCYAVGASDLAPPLIALDAIATLESQSGSREMPLESFFTGPEIDPARENVIEPGELLSYIWVPAPPPGWRGAYTKSRERNAGDFAIVSLAIGYELQDGRMSHVRVVLGGVAPTPLRSIAAEAVLEGSEPTEPVAAAAADAALANAAPLAHNAFKLDLARALIVRGVERLATRRAGSVSS